MQASCSLFAAAPMLGLSREVIASSRLDSIMRRTKWCNKVDSPGTFEADLISDSYEFGSVTLAERTGRTYLGEVVDCKAAGSSSV